MRFLADEGVDGGIVKTLRDEGHDVRWTAEELEGQKDAVVLAAAVKDARILITEDKDFGELVFHFLEIHPCNAGRSSRRSPRGRP
jgi:predicted nuclease of predicted toxin-antitoxin system